MTKLKVKLVLKLSPIRKPRKQPQPESQETRGVTHEDLMLKLCANGAEIARLVNIQGQMQSTLMSLQLENDKLKKEVAEVKKREEQLTEQVKGAQFLAELADKKM